VLDHCTLVIRSQDHSQCNSHVVHGELLPKVDDHIDTVLGVVVFYHYVRTAALKQQQTQYVVVFTTELFAYYLYIRCLSAMKCHGYTLIPSTDEIHQHIKYIIDMENFFMADVLILKLIKIFALKYHHNFLAEHCKNSATVATELDTSQLVELLQQSAVEHLKTYRRSEAQKFTSVPVLRIVATDFEALYAYKRGNYQRCLQLSTQNVNILLHKSSEPIVLSFPQFIQLLDDDIVSLIALTLIVNPECRKCYTDVLINQLTLSLYLMTQCQLKLRHSVTSLAQTLHYIEVAKRPFTLDHLTLKLTECKMLINLTSIMKC